MNTNKKYAKLELGKTQDTTPIHKAPSAARIWDRMAKRYAAKPVADPTAYAEKLSITGEYLHTNTNVLELGCGTGSTALVHAPYVKHIRAVDFSTKMIEIANQKALAEGIKNVDFVCSDVTDELSSPAKYDMVLAHSLLHLMQDWKQTIKAAHSLLKPGGVLITSTPCLGDNAKFLRLIAPLGRRLGVFPQLSFFTRTELEKSMHEVGFDVERAWQPSPKAAVFLVARRAS